MPWVETAKLGLKLCFGAFLLPFLFAYEPSLILIGSPWATVLALARAALALALLSAGFMGYLNSRLTVISRLAVITAGILILIPGLWTDMTGVVIGLIVWSLSRWKNRPINKTTAPLP